MKKLLFSFLLLFALVSLAACNGEDPAPVPLPDPDPIDDAMTEAEAIETMQTAASSVAFLNATISENITFPSSIGDVNVTWQIADTSVITAAGVITQPDFDQDAAVTEVTGQFSYEGFNYSETFTISVAPISEAYVLGVIEDAIAELVFLDEVHTQRAVFPTEHEGVSMSFVSLDQSILTNAGWPNRALYREGVQTVDIKGTFAYRGYTHEATFDLQIGTWPEVMIESVEDVQFRGFASDWEIEDGRINVYHMTNGLVYVDILELLPLLDGGIVYEELEIVIEGNTVTITVEYIADEDDAVFDDVTYQIVFDFDNNTATVNYFSFFSSFSAPTLTDYGAGLDYVFYAVERDAPVTFDFTPYRIEIVKEDDLHLMPIAVANQLLTSSMLHVYYDGQRVYGTDYDTINDASGRGSLGRSTLNGQFIPFQLKDFTYHYMAWSFDYFFGLKDDLGIETFYDHLENYRDRFMGTTSQHYRAIFSFIYGLDDLHSSHAMNGYYLGDQDRSYSLSISDLGTRSQAFYNRLWYEVDDYCEVSPPAGLRFMDNDTIAVMIINGFTAPDPDIEDDLDHTIGIMQGYMDQINEKGTVTDIVLSLACNTGGRLGVALQMLGFLTDEPIEYYNINAGDGSKFTYHVTSENEAGDFNWFIKTSGITYSAANLVTSIAKDMGIATIIGQNSEGGASSVAMNVLPNGSVVRMSSTMVLTNNRHESIEYGIAVDYLIPYSDFGNDAAIIAAVRR